VSVTENASQSFGPIIIDENISVALRSFKGQSPLGQCGTIIDLENNISREDLDILWKWAE